MNGKKIILITEDDAGPRGALYIKLQNEGFVVYEAMNGEEGLAIALREHPDLIMVDVLMPRMDGITMMQKLREDAWGKTAKFIVLTNADDMNTLSKAMGTVGSGGNESFEYLVKTDVKIDEVVAKVKNKLAIK